MKPTVRKVARTAVSLVILLAALWYTLRGVDFTKLVEAMSRANYWWVIASVPAMAASHYLRALRWITLLKPIQSGLSLWNSFSCVMIGYMLNNVVPRGGEVVRPFLLSRRENIRFSTAIATILVERVLDVLSLCLFILATFVQFQSKVQAAFPDINGKLVNALLIPLVGLIVFIVLLMTTNIGEFLLRMLIKPFSESLYAKLHHYLEAFIQGFSIFKSPGLWWRVVAETLPIWILYSLPLYLTFFAFDFDSLYGLTFLDANVLLTITTIAFLIAPTPGAFGFYHSFAQITLVNFYGVPPEPALAFAFVAHGAGFIVQMLVGGGFLLYEQSRGFHLSSVGEVEESPAT
jgi:uncharacterized protein (TIRG00374 family)